MLNVANTNEMLAQVVQTNTGGGGFLLGIPCFGGIIGLACLVLWIWALIDAIGNPRLEGTMKIVWVLVIIFLPFIGSILYLAVGRQKP